MQPAVVALGDELGEAYLPRLLHLLYELEQATMVCLVARYQVGCATEHVMAVLHASDERVQFLAAVAAADHDGLAPRFADRIKELVY